MSVFAVMSGVCLADHFWVPPSGSVRSLSWGRHQWYSVISKAQALLQELEIPLLWTFDLYE